MIQPVRKAYAFILVAALLATTACNDDGKKTAAGAGASAAPVVSAEPSASEVPSPSVAATESVAGRPSPGVTTDKPAVTRTTAKAGTTTKAAAPGNPAATVTEVSVSLEASSWKGSCADGKTHVRVDWKVRLSVTTPQKVDTTLMSSDRTISGGSWYVTNGVVDGESVADITLDQNHPHRVVELWMQVTAPSRVQSAHKSFTVDCYIPPA
jgi:hypothetical protein